MEKLFDLIAGAMHRCRIPRIEPQNVSTRINGERVGVEARARVKIAFLRHRMHNRTDVMRALALLSVNDLHRND